MIKNTIDFFMKSCQINSDVSSTRLTSYIILSAILAFVLYFISIGVYIAITKVNVFIPNELMIVFGSLLAHQLTLLGINKYNETKQMISSAPPVKKVDDATPVVQQPITPIDQR